MNTDQTADLIYLSLLAIVILGSFIVANRMRLGKVLQSAAIWGLIFLGTIAAVGLWGDIRQTVRPTQVAVSANRVEVPRAPDDHFYLTLDLNGAPVTFMVDTGATDIVLSAEDATKAGIKLDELAYLGRANTANGTVRTARVTLDKVALGPITDTRVPAWVNESEMDGSLLGMAYLRRFDTLQITDDKLILQR